MPTRYLKPGIRDSETIDILPPMAEILYYRLLVTVDDYGRYDGRPQMVKSACFPIKDEITAKKAEILLVDLAKAGLVLLYEVAGKPYIQMLKWDNKPRAVVSNFPAPTDGCMQTYADVCNTNTDAPLTVTETKTETKTETETETPPRKRSVLACPSDVGQQIWDDWLSLRKAKRAPVTQTVVDMARAEAQKANMDLEAFLRIWCSRGSQGLEASWLKENERGTGTMNKQEALEARNKAIGDAWLREQGAIV